jgi:hypothetical protein
MNGEGRDLRVRSDWRALDLLQVTIFLFLIFGTAPRVQGQAGSAGTAAQSGAASAIPAQVGLPPEWDAGVRVLVGKIVAEVRPARAISLEVRNISSLGAAEVEAIRKGLEEELRSRGMKLGAAETAVTITLSENVEANVWVAEIQKSEKDERGARIAIVTVSRVVARDAGRKKPTLMLAQRLVWEQPTQFLDFLVAERLTTVMSSSLLILEPDRLVYYRSRTPQWELWQTISFPHVGRGNRTFHGWISTNFQKVWGPGGECSGELGDPAKVTCSTKITIMAGVRIGLRIPGHETYQSELLSERCGDKSVALISGNGDWTQPDSLQGYLFTNVEQPDAIASGGPIEFEGPILSMLADDRESARVIVRNVKTGNYEGYIVTATCSE